MLAKSANRRLRMMINTSKAVEQLRQSGWIEVEDDGFIGHVGPLWALIGGKEVTLGFFAEQKHKNRAGVVQGGMLATLADRTLGMAARLAEPKRRHATIQLNIEYMDVARLGEFVSATGALMRQTKTLAFSSGRLKSNGRLIGTASGIWRIRPGTRIETDYDARTE